MAGFATRQNHNTAAQENNDLQVRSLDAAKTRGEELVADVVRARDRSAGPTIGAPVFDRYSQT